MWLHLNALLHLQLSNVEQQQKAKNDVKTVIKTYCINTKMLWTLMLAMVQKALRKQSENISKTEDQIHKFTGISLFRTDVILTKRTRDFLQSPYWQWSWPALKSNSTTITRLLTIRVCHFSHLMIVYSGQKSGVSRIFYFFFESEKLFIYSAKTLNQKWKYRCLCYKRCGPFWNAKLKCIHPQAIHDVDEFVSL